MLAPGLLAPTGMATARELGWFLFGVFLLAGGFFLAAEHRAHALGALPYLLGLAALMVALFGNRRGPRSAKHVWGGGR